MFGVSLGRHISVYLQWGREGQALQEAIRMTGPDHLGTTERLLLKDKTPGFLASRGDEFNPGPETRLDHSELLCHKVLLKYKGDRESF